MLLSDLVLAVIDRHGKRGCRGRTRLQKEVYFLREALEVQVIYQPHYYGPYSAELAATVQSLVAEGLVGEEQELTPGEGPFERVTYTYRLTPAPNGQTLVDAWKTHAHQESAQFNAAFDKLALSSQSVQELAVASKIHHVVSASNKPVPRSELNESVRQLGWEVSEDEEQKAVNFLLDHGLVKEQEQSSR